MNRKFTAAFLLSIFLFLFYTQGFTQGLPTPNDSCLNAKPFCGEQTYSFAAGVNSGNGQVGPYYSCLSTTPNPAWYFLQIGASGNITIQMYSTPSYDIDFCCWGPFTSPTAACNGGLTSNKVVDCSYSGASTETCTINNAIVGEFYILLITNFQNQPCRITFSQTNFGGPGAGASDCDIVLHCSMLSINPVASTCNPMTNKYSVSGALNFSNPPPTGTMTVTDITAVPPVSQVFTHPFNTPQPFLLTGLTCDNQQHNVVASFSDSTTCTITEHYNSPVPACPVASLSGGGSICANGSTIPVQIALTGAPPFDFTYSINGVPQPPVTNFGGPSPYILNTSTSGVYTLVSVLNSFCAGTVSGTATITLLPLPVPVVAGPPSACLNTTQTYTTAAGMKNYIWNVPSGGTIVAGTGTNSIQVLWTAVGSKTVTLSYTGANDCPSASPTSYPVTVRPLPVPVITGSTLVCPGITESYSTDLSMSNYIWALSPGGTKISGGTPADPVISVAWNGAGPHTISVKYTNADGCVASSATSLTVNVKPLPVVQINNASICSATPTNINLNSSIPGSNFVWTCLASSPAVTGFADGSVSPIIQTLTSTSLAREYVVYHITATASGCSGPSGNDTVFIKPTPDVILSPSPQTICGNQSTGINLSSNVANTIYSWTVTPGSANVSGYSAGTGNSIVQTLNTPGTTVETVTYHVSPSALACPGIAQDVLVTINPKPHLTTSPMTETICSEGITNIALTSSAPGTLYTWTVSVITGNVTGQTPGSGDLIAQTLTNQLPTIGKVAFTISQINGTCNGNDTTFNVFVKPKPHVLTATPDTMICSGNPTAVHLNSDVTGASYTWTASGSSANITGFSAGSGDIIANTLINTGFTNETVTYSLTAHANGCDGDVHIYTVLVHPVADVYFDPPSQTICSSTPSGISVLSHVAVAGFTWTATGSSANVTGFSAGSGSSIIQNLVNTGDVPETVTYTVTPAAYGCNGNPLQVVITVNPVAAVTASPVDQAFCSGSLVSINLTSNVGGSSYAWTAASTSLALTGFSDGSGDLISQTLSNSGFDIDTVIYSVTPTANGCTGTSKSFYRMVKPVPDLSNIPLIGQICSGSNTNLPLTSHVSGPSFAWTCTPSSANITGFGSGSGTSINQTLVNLGLNPETVTYHTIPSANGCDGPVTNYLMNISEVPDVYFSPAAQTICPLQTTNISLQSHVNGTSYNWTASGSSANVTGFADGAGTNIAQVLNNTGNSAETVTYTVAPDAFGCPPGIALPVIITVNPKPAVNNPITAFSICPATATNIPLSCTQPSPTYTWTATGSSANVTGFSNSSGPVIMQTLSNSGFNDELVTYSVTPTANSCPGDPFNFLVTVFPVADVILSPPIESFCSGSVTNLAVSSNVPSSTYTWTANGSSGNITGYSPGSGNLIQQTLINSGFSIESATYTITPLANGCTGTFKSALVTVNPLPSLTFNLCNDLVTTLDAKPFTLRGGTPIGGNYKGPGIGAGLFNPALAGAGTHVLTYTYNNNWGCSDSITRNITVLAPAAFACGTMITDPRDNQTYPTIQIGTQCWMAANLNYGTAIPSSSTQRDNCTTEKYCYSDNPANCATRGGLYQWDELMQFDNTAAVQGLCPPSWHIPKDAEWNTLFNYYNGLGFAASALKGTGFSGFNALTDGSRFDNRGWNFLNFATFFWSSDAHGPYKARAHAMNTYDPSVSSYPSNRSNALSVRCIKD